MGDLLLTILQATAWTIKVPKAGSLPVLALTVFGAALSVCAAWAAAGRVRRPGRVLFFCGLILAAAELYKQAFLYAVVFEFQYNWWYFPFQLCSVPMYLCLLLPLLPAGRVRRLVLTFLQDFGLLGGIMALLVPDGFLWEYAALTFHGFFWHFLLIFIGCFIAFARLADTTKAGYLDTLPLYGLCCLAATAINLAVQYFCWPDSYADMFYINPCFPSEQAVFHSIAVTFGTPAGLISYLLATMAGALLVHTACRRFPAPRRKAPSHPAG